MIARSTQTALPFRRDGLAQTTAIGPYALPLAATPSPRGDRARWKRWNGGKRPGPHIGSAPAPAAAISRPRAGTNAANGGRRDLCPRGYRHSRRKVGRVAARSNARNTTFPVLFFDPLDPLDPKQGLGGNEEGDRPEPLRLRPSRLGLKVERVGKVGFRHGFLGFFRIQGRRG